MKRFFANLLVVSVLSLSLCACSDEADNGKTEGSGFGTGTPGEMLSPSDQKEKLSAIASELITTMESTQFEESINSILEIMGSASTMGSLPTELMEQYVDFITELHEDEIGSFAQYTTPDNTVFFDYEKFYGVYTYNSEEGEWTCVPSTSELKLIVDGNTLRFTASGKIKLSSEMQNKEVPTKVNITLSDSEGAQLFGVTAKISEFDIATMKYKCSAEGTYGPLTVNASETFGGGKGEARLSIKHNKKLLVSAYAGVGDVDLDALTSGDMGVTYEVKSDDTSDDAAPDDTSDVILNEATIYINVLDKLHFCGTCNNIKELISKIDEADEQYRVDVGTNWYNTEEYYQTIVGLYDEYVSLGWNFDNSKVFVGEIKFDYDYDVEVTDSYCSDYTDVNAVLFFNEDNSLYHFGGYFTRTAFESVIESAQELVMSYSKLLGGVTTDDEDIE